MHSIKNFLNFAKTVLRNFKAFPPSQSKSLGLGVQPRARCPTELKAFPPSQSKSLGLGVQPRARCPTELKAFPPSQSKSLGLGVQPNSYGECRIPFHKCMLQDRQHLL